MKKPSCLTLAATLALVSLSTAAIATTDPYDRTGAADPDVQAITTDPVLAALLLADGSVKNMGILAGQAFAFGVTSLTANGNGTFNAVYGGHTYTFAVDPTVQQGADLRQTLIVDGNDLIILYGDGTSQRIIILGVR